MSEDLVARLQADGELQSSGRFSWDFRRLGTLLEQYQLADPEHYVLRALASAVLGKASYFRLVQRGLNTRIRWDGQAATQDELEELSPISGPPRLTELAVALLAAGRLGRVEFAWVEGEARLHLARSGWRNLFGRGRSLNLLAERGCYAPLQMDVPSLLGNSLQELESARVLWGSGRTIIVRDGVTFPGPSIGGVDVLARSDSLPLDLTRSRLVQGNEFQAWWAALLDRVFSLLHPQRPAAFLSWALANGVGHPAFEQAAIFARGDGGWATFAELHEEYETNGYLRILGGPAPWDAVVSDPANKAFLGRHFPNQLSVDEVKPAFTRLPLGHQYPVKLPLESGEVGIRDRPLLESRIWDEDHWKSKAAFPRGWDRTTHFSIPLDVQIIGVRALAKLKGPDHPLVQFHWISYLQARALLLRKDPVKFQIETERVGQSRLLGPLEAISEVEFRLRHGGTVTLETLAHQRGDWRLLDPNGTQGLLTDGLIGTLLVQLLGPEFRCSGFAEPRFSRTCYRLLGEDVLSRILADPECAGYQALREAKIDLAGRSPALDWRANLVSVLGSRNRCATSIHVLLALGFEELVELVPHWGERENLQDLQEDEANFVGELRVHWLEEMAECLARMGRLGEALERGQEAVRSFPDCWASWNLLGLVRGWNGELKLAEYCYTKSLELQGGYPFQRGRYAEVLWAAGLPREARPQVEGEGTLARLMRARLESDAELALKLCQHLLSDPDCPLSVYERLGQVLSDLGRSEEARQHYLRFVSARPDQILEANILERREVAAHWLMSQK